MDIVNRLSWLTISLHWVIGITIIGLIGIGLYMTNLEVFELYDIHKSVGIALSVLIILRVIWRLKQGWPKPVSNYAKHEVMLSKIVHWVLIVSTVLMPISGMLYSGGSGHGFAVFGLEILRENPDPSKLGEVIPLSEFWGNFGQTAHQLIGYLLILAIFLHVAGALKHHLIDKDATLLRMLGKNS